MKPYYEAGKIRQRVIPRPSNRAMRSKRTVLHCRVKRWGRITVSYTIKRCSIKWLTLTAPLKKFMNHYYGTAIHHNLFP